ncbi:MAG: molybdate ABC transporter substrate-binding protein [Ruegeria sp.]
MLSRACRTCFAVLAFCALAATPVRAAAEDVLVFAAASLKNAMDEIAAEFERESGQNVTISFAATSALARQIQFGAPADLFISANKDWMDVLEKEGLIDSKTRVNLVGNGLVLIGQAGIATTDVIGSDFELKAALGGGFLAMALVDAVPAGIYGKTALGNLGLWESVSEHVAQTDNVRAALMMVSSGATPLGIVYRSDAISEDEVDIVGRFPAETHPPTVYPAAATAGARPQALEFLDYLQTRKARKIFLGQGFSLAGG